MVPKKRFYGKTRGLETQRKSEMGGISITIRKGETPPSKEHAEGKTKVK